MAKLAIKGGNPVIPGGLKAKWPIFDDADKKALIEVLESGRWCSAGWYFKEPLESRVAQFEKEFAEWNGAKYGIATTNGTSSLVLALKAGGVEAGDEVIVPAVTFIASATAVILVNAIPIFVDIDPDTYQISPERIEEAITEKTKAIMPVHYGGYPADMDKIMEIAKRHNLLVIEDAAEAHGSEWRGRRVGSIGDMGCFSFQMGKPLTCGEGGIVLTDNEELKDRCYSYGDLGRMPGGEKYEHYIPAGNNRMTEFQGALLLVQLSRLEEQTNIRHENGEYFARELEKIEGISALKRDPRVTKRGYYFYFLRYDQSRWNDIPRDKFMEALRAEGVPCSTAHNQPLYKNPLFREMAFGKTGCPVSCPLYGKKIDYSKVSCPVSERVYESEVVALGKDFLMERENVDRVLEAIYKIRENIDELK
ncbi:DegT/DnrJ/EryC1/StrS family aminotransferase [Candidatus Aerophobetes bacterium]|uniref:DegT/DnrJ/EryC1/StrS family aminotransferase n=1 Tax=Aerophobetes bacterium TaxID=2030807 RepID=A0A497E2E0_UNCAE|nr:MAG: DegT/DnrJ/EryC1/StrS family aminotransferase [Candidatus Aerophobetes bacterium]